MKKKVTVSYLRSEIKHVINEVSYGQSEYVVEKHGEPTVAIISMEDYELLQQIKRENMTMRHLENAASLQNKLALIHERLAVSEYKTRSREEIDAELQKERDSWEE